MAVFFLWSFKSTYLPNIDSWWDTNVEDAFVFDKDSSFTVARVTADSGIQYFVQSGFAKEAKRRDGFLEEVESKVEGNYLTKLEEDCKVETFEREKRLHTSTRSRGDDMASELQYAYAENLPSCEALQDYLDWKTG